MRDASIAVIREIGVETGGSNIQFAVNPETGRLIVIEMNPRVSRSSALASKATGFPIAKIAAKLAVGYTLDELDNDITQETPASFEPTIDYVVTKIPRFAFEKFPGAEPLLTTADEVRRRGDGHRPHLPRVPPEGALLASRPASPASTTSPSTAPTAPTPTPRSSRPSRSRPPTASASPPRPCATASPTTRSTRRPAIDPWFLARIREIVDEEARLIQSGLPPRGPRAAPPEDDGLLRRPPRHPHRPHRKLGPRRAPAPRRPRRLQAHRHLRRRVRGPDPLHVLDLRGRGDGHRRVEARPSDNRKVIILGGGPNRIGQGIEFDYCCCHACFALTKAGFETIMVNCNPETVSTDYDTSDRLYFEPLTLEHVLEILRVEQENGTLHGVIVQFGGQTPLKLANALHDAGIPILGTTPDAIDLAEDRERFQALLHRLGLRQPRNGIARSPAQAMTVAKEIGYPLVIRPSYVLGGRAMEIVRDDAQLQRYITSAVQVSRRHARPPRQLPLQRHRGRRRRHLRRPRRSTSPASWSTSRKPASTPATAPARSRPTPSTPSPSPSSSARPRSMALALGVVGLMNVQFAIQDGDIYVLEVNPRASRTVPFVAKATDSAIAAIAARVMAGEPLANFLLRAPYPAGVGPDDPLPYADPLTLADPAMPWFSVKEAVMPFNRFPGVDTLLGPEMRSTGEVMGWDRTFPRAFLKAQMGAGTALPTSGTLFVSVKDGDKNDMLLEATRLMHALGFRILATDGTAAFLSEHAIPTTRVNKVYQGRPHIVDTLKDGGVQIVFNTTEGAQSINDSRAIRSLTLSGKIPYYTTAAGARAVALAMQDRLEGDLRVRSLQG